jgi:hypothetical protein
LNAPVSKLLRCAIYTRKSTEHNLDLAFTSLDAQRESCEAYIKSQAHEGWRLVLGRYDDGAFRTHPERLAARAARKSDRLPFSKIKCNLELRLVRSPNGKLWRMAILA